jgi:hypothetical protein
VFIRWRERARVKRARVKRARVKGARVKGARVKGARVKGARVKGARVRDRGRVLARHSPQGDDGRIAPIFNIARHYSQGDDGRIAPIFNIADPVSPVMMPRVRSPMPMISATLIVMVTDAGGHP